MMYTTKYISRIWDTVAPCCLKDPMWDISEVYKVLASIQFVPEELIPRGAWIATSPRTDIRDESATPWRIIPSSETVSVVELNDGWIGMMQERGEHLPGKTGSSRVTIYPDFEDLYSYGVPHPEVVSAIQLQMEPSSTAWLLESAKRLTALAPAVTYTYNDTPHAEYVVDMVRKGILSTEELRRKLRYCD